MLNNWDTGLVHPSGLQVQNSQPRVCPGGASWLWHAATLAHALSWSGRYEEGKGHAGCLQLWQLIVDSVPFRHCDSPLATRSVSAQTLRRLCGRVSEACLCDDSRPVCLIVCQNGVRWCKSKIHCVANCFTLQSKKYVVVIYAVVELSFHICLCISLQKQRYVFYLFNLINLINLFFLKTTLNQSTKLNKSNATSQFIQMICCLIHLATSIIN